MHLSDADRRRFLIQAALLASATPVLLIAGSGKATAAPPRLPVSNAQAKALSYTETAGTAKHPLRKPNSRCSNCSFFTTAPQACSIFPGFVVAPAGWCSAWVQKKA